MKRFLSYLVVGIIASTISVEATQFEYNYKVYNPRENKTFTVKMGTIGFGPISEDIYVFGFIHNEKPYCIIRGNSDIKNDLVNGTCTDYEAYIKYLYKGGQGIDLKPYQYSWREIKPASFYFDMKELRHLRKQEGMKEVHLE